MKSLKNIGVGFAVSFLGSIPLGYLNLAGLEIYSNNGIYDLLMFLSGVILIETFVIYFTLKFALQIMMNKKLMKFIDLFSVVLMFALAYVFFISTDKREVHTDFLSSYLMFSPFAVGVILNCFNFLQLPFWTGWALFLIDGKYIVVDGNLKYYYIAGTAAGVFSGMFSLIVVLYAVFQKADQFSNLILPIFIPLFFFCAGCIQLIKVCRKT